MTAFMRLFSYFLIQSLLGGIDVSKRALSPRHRVQPFLIRYPLRLPPGKARIFFVISASLLPGTLSARLEGDDLTVHVLDRGIRAESVLRGLEARIGAVVGLGG